MIRPVTRRRSRPWLMAALAVLIALLTAVPARTPATAAPKDAVSIELEQATPDYLGQDDELTFTGTITNHSSTELESVTVWWRMRTAVLTEETFIRWLEGEEDVEPLTLARLDLPEPIDAGEEQRFEMVVPPESSPFDYGSTSGARGIELVVTGTDADAERVYDAVRSTIVWYSPGEAGPTPLTVAVPLTPTADEWEEALQESGPVADAALPRILDIITELSDHPVTWGVDAALLDPIPTGSLGHLLPAGQDGEEDTAGDVEEEDAEDPARDPLTWPASDAAGQIGQALTESAGPAPVVSLGWAGPDYHALNQVGTDGDLIRERNHSYAREVLTAAGLAPRPEVAWSLTPITAGEASRFEEPITQVIVPPIEGGARIVPPTAQHVTMQSPNREFVDLLTGDISAGDLRALSLIHSREAASLLATLPRDLTPAQAETLAANLTVLQDLPWLELSARGGEEAPDGRVASFQPEAPVLSPAEVSTLAEFINVTDPIGHITEEPQKFSQVIHTTAFLAASHTWTDDAAAPEEILTRAREVAGREFVAIARPSTVNLISQGGDLPVGVDNLSLLTVHPTVVVEPEDPRLLVDERVEAELRPEQSTTVMVPITAVANGNVDATIRLLDDEGREVARPQTFTVRVRADWETTGTAVVAGIVAVGFLFGLFRNIRSSGRHSRGV